ncbi:hypothetical protein GQ55_4G086700 [Panicum hallii var. hallii]|uniref:Serine/arginine repetitive matrix protein 2 n=1 Tax=Panicum hallii var. hallii TaxID=1504633 RepID=A0A2T7DWN3_9POAL|nr:hypothetical protein GQ55_4G086700 [Panicum hallii var. hallii]
MAAAFRSGTRRGDAFAALEDAGSATRGRPAAGGGGGGSSVRRSRSLSRFPPPSPSPEDAATPSSRFVNKVRGGGRGGLPPEISLDDLADEFFRARAESEDDEEEDVAVARGRSRYPAPAEKGAGGGRRSSTARYARETESSRQRERSVSRPPAERRGVAANAVKGGPAARRQRYASVDRRASMDRHRWCDSDNDMEVSHRYVSRGIHTKSSSGNSLQNSFSKSSKANHALKRSTSQKDFFHSRDSSSSHSSLTDDESRSSHSFYIRNQKAACAVYGLDKEHQIGDEAGNVLYDVMRKEVRQAVEEIRTQLEKTVTKSEPSEKVLSSDTQPTQVITELRRSYTNKLEESEKRKQELLAQLAAEEQHGHELTKIVRELLPTPKKTANPQRQPRHRRRSNDRSKMSKRLTEEAEQYFEDFLSNVEDTDFSSFDGEKSDTSSTRKDVLHHAMTETPVAIPTVASHAEADGVVLPWLQWETTNDLQTSPCKTKPQGESMACSTSNQTVSSRGSWSPGDYATSTTSNDKLLTRFEEVGIPQSSCPHVAGTSSFHIDDYLHLRQSEDLLFEKWRQKQRIESGGLFLCSRPTIL